jgi:hypothetical protein
MAIRSRVLPARAGFVCAWSTCFSMTKPLRGSALSGAGRHAISAGDVLRFGLRHEATHVAGGVLQLLSGRLLDASLEGLQVRDRDSGLAALLDGELRERRILAHERGAARPVGLDALDSASCYRRPARPARRLWRRADFSCGVAKGRG